MCVVCVCVCSKQKNRIDFVIVFDEANKDNKKARTARASVVARRLEAMAVAARNARAPPALVSGRRLEGREHRLV